jgi:uncharacterized protein YegL
MKTYVYFVLDESGSMNGKQADVVGGFNAYVAELHKDTETEYAITLCKFDDVRRFPIVNKELDDVPELKIGFVQADELTYVPRANTALYDAIGSTLKSAEVSDDDKGILFVYTDGFENASREYTAEAVKTEIARLTKQGNWTFVFMGADLDRWEAERAAATMGLPTTQVAHTSKGQTLASFRAASSTTAGWAAGSYDASIAGTVTQTNYNAIVCGVPGCSDPDPKHVHGTNAIP